MSQKQTLGLSPQEYNEIAEALKPKPRLWRNSVLAFVIGGSICAIAQFLINIFCQLGHQLKEAQTIGTVCMIFLGALLTGLGLYDNIVTIGGAGGILPVTGFANAMVSPAMEYKREGYITGVGAKMFTVAGPVIITATISAFIVGLLRLLFSR